jgi:hypothetical protein
MRCQVKLAVPGQGGEAFFYRYFFEVFPCAPRLKAFNTNQVE